MRFFAFLIVFAISTLASNAFAQRGPSLPRSGMQGSAGVGFTNFTIITPKNDFSLDRGTYVAAAIERGFDFAGLYLALSISQMTADGKANYRYQGTSVSYSADGVGLSARMFDLALGLKWKVIEDYWLRPYVGGGGIGGYEEVSYDSNATLRAQGDDFKSKDTVMGFGYYGEAGIEAQFSERFGVLLAARLSDFTSKPLDTLGGAKLHYQAETYFFSALFGF